MTKGSIYQESIPVVNIYVSNTGSPKYRNQKLTGLKGEISNNKLIVENLIPHFEQWIYDSYREWIAK